MKSEIHLTDHLEIREWDEPWDYPSDSLLSIPKIFPSTALLYTEYENNYGGGPMLNWSRQNAYLAPLVCALYLLAIYFGKKFMAQCKPFDLRSPLRYWNLCLAVFSLIGTLRVAPHVGYMYYEYGPSVVMCSPPAFTFGHGPAGLWIIFFVYSKYFELIDTAFIVLRKKPLSFLHWYHHVTVLLYTWDAMIREQPCGIVFVSMNYAVHAIMYFYYYLTACGFRPRWGKIVTVLQISQMVVGIAATTVGLHFAYNYPEIRYMEVKDVFSPTNVGCYVSRKNLYAAVLMYASYLALFVHFFVNRYLMPSKRVVHHNPKEVKKVE
eukprot:GHVN01005629.1.p1 GENE.GHVN01005629.1~~GHVN01005629.1.p1  ORF type:complete len:322 (+),score=10.82 GHVN01005629.1:283-1248(+)